MCNNCTLVCLLVFFQAEDGIRVLVRSRGLGDVYKRQDYVRTEMGRAERIAQAGDKKRGNNVGFALTVLQRRLASSPEAILRSLERRQQRLDTKLRDMQRITDDARFSTPISSHIDEWTTGKTTLDFGSDALPAFSVDDFEDFDEETTDEERAQFEEQADQVVDLATAAQTIPATRNNLAYILCCFLYFSM